MAGRRGRARRLAPGRGLRAAPPAGRVLRRARDRRAGAGRRGAGVVLGAGPPAPPGQRRPGRERAADRRADRRRRGRAGRGGAVTHVSPELTLVIPLLGAVIIALLGRWPNAREAVTLACAAALLLAVGSLFPAVLEHGARPAWRGPEVLPGLGLVLEVEPLGLIYAGVAALLWLPNSLYSIGYMRGHHETNQTRFFACFALSIASAMGIAFSGNLVTLFVFYEALSLATFPLVTHHGTEKAQRAGRLYVGFLFGTSMVLMLLAIVWTWTLTGTVDFRAGGILGDVSPGLTAVLFGLFMLGSGKAAVMPFHFWLPSAMVAPTPVSALLHAVAVVKAGVFVVLKVSVYVFGVDTVASGVHHEWLLYLAAATILIASIVAMTKDDLKARLAYSTVGQLSYIVLGAALGNSLGVAGGGLHIAMHAFGKITLFFCAGAIYVAAHKTKVSELTGLGRRMPFTMLAFAVGALSIIGLPPLGGAWSKWYLGLATLEAGHAGLLVVLLISSLLNVAYLLPIPLKAFFLPPPPGDGAHGGADEGIHEAPLPCLIALGLTALGSVALFFWPDLLLRLVTEVAPLGS
ncbi:MAG: monovalent cation/H+ antiporter subunit D family protein [Planctomycetota bacterium]|nr:monovalent cation/H+ antiporter subunit D family protein [Planctomycetota bacterium]